MSPSTPRYFEDFGQGPMDYPGPQMYGNGGNWQQEAFNGYVDGSNSPEHHHYSQQL